MMQQVVETRKSTRKSKAEQIAPLSSLAIPSGWRSCLFLEYLGEREHLQLIARVSIIAIRGPVALWVLQNPGRFLLERRLSNRFVSIPLIAAPFSSVAKSSLRSVDIIPADIFIISVLPAEQSPVPGRESLSTTIRLLLDERREKRSAADICDIQFGRFFSSVSSMTI